jgi:acetyl-CoA C-acetyltransferase
MRDVFIFDTVRTPRGKGKKTGALYERRPIDLLSTMLDSLKDRNKLDTAEVDDVIIGCVTPVDGQGYNIAKAGVLHAGWDDSVPGIQINRYCASGLESVNMGTAKIMSGMADLIVAGGVESMSRVPMGADGGALLHDPELINNISYVQQGVSADLIATLEGFTRAELDQYAFDSHQKAAHAAKEDYFSKSMIPVVDCNGLIILDKDEAVRPNTSIEALNRLDTSFKGLGESGFATMALLKYPLAEKLDYVHTAGNSSGIVDGASLALIGSAEAGEKMGLRKRARIIASSLVSTEPTIMLTGIVPAVEKALSIAKLTVNDIDLWEINEAFASVVLKASKDLGLDKDKVNVNGGAIALGHPLGATGTILLGTLLDELERRGLRYGCVTLCAGAGIGVAAIIERL